MAQPITKTGECTGLTRYTAPSGDNWGQFPIKPNGFDVGTLQNPLTPQQSANCIEVPAGLKAELWASEADSGSLAPASPTSSISPSTSADACGPSSPAAIPTPSAPPPAPSPTTSSRAAPDRILILEDTNGDKVVDKVKVFKERPQPAPEHRGRQRRRGGHHDPLRRLLPQHQRRGRHPRRSSSAAWAPPATSTPTAPSAASCTASTTGSTATPATTAAPPIPAASTAAGPRLALPPHRPGP